jgi:hypothetical protein
MSIEKMREEFEAWARIEMQCSLHREWIKPEHYAQEVVEFSWRAWQASRAAIEVELPDDGIEDCQDAWGERCKNTFDCGYNFASLRHEQAMQAAGLKVKA